VKSKLGRIDNKVRMAGPVAYNPFLTKVIKVNVRTMNLSIKENLPSKEGLTILSESSILYHIKAEDVPKVIKEQGSTTKKTSFCRFSDQQPQTFVRATMQKTCTVPSAMKSSKKSEKDSQKYVKKKDL